MEKKSVIADWYEDQHIFITGATGFMGKVLIEKLLRCCPKLAKIYMMVRSKKGKNPQQRLVDFLDSPVFNKIRADKSATNLFEKLKCIEGDVLNESCALSLEDQKLLQNNVTCTFHMAANVRFDQDLPSALKNNTGGTKNVLDLACTFKKLKVFVHVSTSYCHCKETVLEERLYAAPHDPRKMLELMDCLEPDLIKMITPKLLQSSPNTYAYTKCLTEQLVSEYADKLPIVIGRPSIVTAAWKEPLPGWVDNLNGPTGIMIGAGKGVIRTMHANGELEADVVPVDVSCNILLMLAWKTGSMEAAKKEIEVYHITADKEQVISWNNLLEVGKKHVLNNPFTLCLWYPGGSMKSSYFVHMIAFFFFHLVPAYFVDFCMIVGRQKPFLVKTQKRIKNGLEVLQYYATRPWFFHNEKSIELYESLSETDKEIFYINRGNMDLEEYMLNYVLGARTYCVKDAPETIPQARKMFKRLYYLDLIKDVILYGLVVYFFIIYAFRFLTSVEDPFVYINNTIQSHLTTIKSLS